MEWSDVCVVRESHTRRKKNTHLDTRLRKCVTKCVTNLCKFPRELHTSQNSSDVVECYTYTAIRTLSQGRGGASPIFVSFALPASSPLAFQVRVNSNWRYNHARSAALAWSGDSDDDEEFAAMRRKEKLRSEAAVAL